MDDNRRRIREENEAAEQRETLMRNTKRQRGAAFTRADLATAELHEAAKEAAATALDAAAAAHASEPAHVALARMLTQGMNRRRRRAVEALVRRNARSGKKAGA